MPEEDTIFHKIIRREIPAEILYEDEQAIAIRDIAPVSNAHFLVIPKKNMPSLDNAVEEDANLLGHMLLICAQLARDNGIAEDGYRVVINTGEYGAQSVFQLHMHLLGGRAFGWPPG